MKRLVNQDFSNLPSWWSSSITRKWKITLFLFNTSLIGVPLLTSEIPILGGHHFCLEVGLAVYWYCLFWQPLLHRRTKIVDCAPIKIPVYDCSIDCKLTPRRHWGLIGRLWLSSQHCVRNRLFVVFAMAGEEGRVI